MAVLAAGLPYKLGLMLAALTGIVVGLALEMLHPAPTRRIGQRQSEPQETDR